MSLLHLPVGNVDVAGLGHGHGGGLAEVLVVRPGNERSALNAIVLIQFDSLLNMSFRIKDCFVSIRKKR